MIFIYSCVDESVVNQFLIFQSAKDYEETVSKAWESPRDVWWHDVMKDASEDCKLGVMWGTNRLL